VLFRTQSEQVRKALGGSVWVCVCVTRMHRYMLHHICVIAAEPFQCTSLSRRARSSSEVQLKVCVVPFLLACLTPGEDSAAWDPRADPGRHG
jgi:hypothetical protein